MFTFMLFKPLTIITVGAKWCIHLKVKMDVFTVLLEYSIISYQHFITHD